MALRGDSFLLIRCCEYFGFGLTTFNRRGLLYIIYNINNNNSDDDSNTGEDILSCNYIDNINNIEISIRYY